jgi:hypothetical protein
MAVGVPEITPELERLKPAGSEPDAMLKVLPPLPSEVESV